MGSFLSIKRRYISAPVQPEQEIHMADNLGQQNYLTNPSPAGKVTSERVN